MNTDIKCLIESFFDEIDNDIYNDDTTSIITHTNSRVLDVGISYILDPLIERLELYDKELDFRYDLKNRMFIITKNKNYTSNSVYINAGIIREIVNALHDNNIDNYTIYLDIDRYVTILGKNKVELDCFGYNIKVNSYDSFPLLYLNNLCLKNVNIEYNNNIVCSSIDFMYADTLSILAHKISINAYCINVNDFAFIDRKVNAVEMIITYSNNNSNISFNNYPNNVPLHISVSPSSDTINRKNCKNLLFHNLHKIYRLLIMCYYDTICKHISLYGLNPNNTILNYCDVEIKLSDYIPNTKFIDDKSLTFYKIVNTFKSDLGK